MWPASQYSHTNNASSASKINDHQNPKNLKTLGMTSAISMAGVYYFEFLNFFNAIFLNIYNFHLLILVKCNLYYTKVCLKSRFSLLHPSTGQKPLHVGA